MALVTNGFVPRVVDGDCNEAVLKSAGKLRFGMLRIVAFTITLLCCTTPSTAQVYDSYAFGRHYRADVPRASLEKSPAWDDDAQNPPISARNAIVLADEVRELLVGDEKDWVWSAESAALVRGLPKKWYWLIKFTGLPQKGGIAGGAPYLFLVVPMDGIPLKPQLIPPKPQPEPKKRKPK